MEPNLLEDTLINIEKSVSTGVFIDCENAKVELKDLSSGQSSEWDSLKESVCAFLNTEGGYIICGVRERDKKYYIKGFDRNNEPKLVDLHSKFFKSDDESLLDLSDFILLDFKIFFDKTVAIISVKPLSEDLKYVKYKNDYWERKLTGDKKIPQSKILQRKEYKAELEYSKELSVVKNATVADFSLDKINEYIIRVNKTGVRESIKKDLTEAKEFLIRKYCINSDSQVTTLGLLLFGEDPGRFLEDRSRLDCYFETGNDIGRDKKYFESDVIRLMDDAFAFVWGHIKVGRSYVGGGRSEPEFPEKLIREVVNNALAHRDYTVNKFITIKINPSQSIEIKNPGSFKQKMLITESTSNTPLKRILPLVAETKNPKLANFLKSFDKIESQGIGMSTLVSVCLDNQIDVPYYNLSVPNEISLVIPSGKLIDDETQFWLNSYYKFIDNKLNGKITREHELVIAYMLKSEKLNKKGFYTILFSHSNNHKNVLQDLKEAGLIMESFIESFSQVSVYKLIDELTYTNFSKQVTEIINYDLDKFDRPVREILNIIYRYNHYNDESIKPNVITPELYYILHGKEINPTTYESLGRKVRKICNDLTKENILEKHEDKSYSLRKNGVNTNLKLDI